MPTVSRDEMKVLEALHYTDWDWRTVDGIAAETSFRKSKIKKLVAELKDLGYVIEAEQPDVQGRTLYSVPHGFQIDRFSSGSSKAKAKSSKRQWSKRKPRVFIVHGHDKEAREEIKGLVEGAGMEGIILAEKEVTFRTILQKFESHARTVKYAIGLLTPDDFGAMRADYLEKRFRPRARQNVIFELGYFLGKLGGKKVCAVIKGADLEWPSDIGGIDHLNMSDPSWRDHLRKALKKAKS